MKNEKEDLIDVNDSPTLPPIGPEALKIVDHFGGLEEAAKDYTVPCPEWCAELWEVQQEIARLKEREEKLKAVAKKWKDRGAFVHGGYTLKLTERAGSRTLDKDALLARLESELGADEAKVYVEACTKIGKPSLVISVEKICQAGSPGGEA